MRELAIVIVNWNTRQLLADCLACLVPLQQEATVVVVDNGSADKSADYVRAKYPWVKLIANDRNVGYARANNQGWRSVDEQYVLLLNSDTLPDAKAVRDMRRYLSTHHHVGAVGPYLQLRNGDAQVGAGGWELSLRSALCYQLLLHRFFGGACKPFFLHQPAYRGRSGIKVDWVSGAAMMTRRSVLEQVGGIPEQYFMYAEDIAYCTTLRALNYQVVYLPDTAIVHVHGGSAPASDANTRWLSSTFRYFEERRGRYARRALAAIFVVGALLRIVLVLFPNFRQTGGDRNRVAQYWDFACSSFRATVGSIDK